MATAATHKRWARSASSDALLRQEGCDPALKRREVKVEPAAASPLLAPLPGESKASFFRRLGARLCRRFFRAALDFDADGIYIYKRPVRSGSGDKAALLASGGSVFHHVVVYVKQRDELTALEFGPANAMDITDNMLVETAAGPVLQSPGPAPEPDCLPMLHLAGVLHHTLDSPHVQQALAFAQAQPYHALRQNCIAFADFIVRVLTGGLVRGVPLIFDHIVGKVPAVDSPLLALLALTTQMSWHDVTDGSRLMRAFLQQHPAPLPLPPGACADNLQLLQEAAEPEDAAPAAKAAAQAGPAAPLLAAGLPGLSGPLAAFLSSSGLLPPLPDPAAPADSSGSEDTYGGVQGATNDASSAPSSSAGPGQATASTYDSFATTGASKRPALHEVKGPQLPARRTRAPPAAQAQ